MGGPEVQDAAERSRELEREISNAAGDRPADCARTPTAMPAGTEAQLCAPRARVGGEDAVAAVRASARALSGAAAAAAARALGRARPGPRPAARVADDDAAPAPAAPADRNEHRMEDHPACLAPALVAAAQRAAAGARARPRRDRNDRDTTILLPDTIVVSRNKSRAAGAWFLCAGGAPDSRAARLADVVAAVLEAPAARSTVLAADGAGGLAAATARRPRGRGGADEPAALEVTWRDDGACACAAVPRAALRRRAEAVAGAGGGPGDPGPGRSVLQRWVRPRSPGHDHHLRVVWRAGRGVRADRLPAPAPGPAPAGAGEPVATAWLLRALGDAAAAVAGSVARARGESRAPRALALVFKLGAANDLHLLYCERAHFGAPTAAVTPARPPSAQGPRRQPFKKRGERPPPRAAPDARAAPAAPAAPPAARAPDPALRRRWIPAARAAPPREPRRRLLAAAPAGVAPRRAPPRAAPAPAPAHFHPPTVPPPVARAGVCLGRRLLASAAAAARPRRPRSAAGARGGREPDRPAARPRTAGAAARARDPAP